MKWIDYRTKLEIAFDDHQKFNMLGTMLKNYVEVVMGKSYDEKSYYNYCQMVGEAYNTYEQPYRGVKNSLERSQSIEEIVAKYVALYNTYEPRVRREFYHVELIDRERILDSLKKSLEQLNISYEVIKDDDGIFVFPIGAQELDEALVFDVLDWLSKFPNTKKMYSCALKQYSERTYIRDVADNLRKALEEFLREFLKNNNDLNKNKKEVEHFLKDKGADSHLITMLVSLISHYYLLNNEVAKHNDKVDARYLEFLLYQTGIFIRMLIIVNIS